jgi:hypothetical protein
MKKLVLAACALTCAASVFAQGTVVFNNRVTGTVVTHVYSGATAQSGNAANDFPTGATSWAGYTPLDGAGYSAQLWAAPGAGAAEASLKGALPITTFRSGSGAGFVNGVTATLTDVPADAPVATMQLRVWDNKNGTVNDWATASAGTGAFGKSPLFEVQKIGGVANPAPNLTGLVSFSITGGGTVVPEPSTFALAGLGAAALLIFRRRK